MALDPENLPSDRQADRLARLYAEAQKDLVRMIEQAVLTERLATVRNRRLQLAAILAYLDRLGLETDPVARKAVAQANTDGATLAAADVARLGASVSAATEATFFQVNTEAVGAAQDALLDRLEGARSTVGRQVADVFRRKGLEQSTRALLGVEGSPQRASRRLARELAADGKTAFVDRAGRRWKLADYAEMAVRTTTREAVVAGQVNRLAAHGISLVRISSHADSCEVCKPYENRLIDLAGTMTEWEDEPVASGPLPPFHPRCRHTILGVSVRVEAVRRQLEGAV